MDSRTPLLDRFVEVAEYNLEESTARLEQARGRLGIVRTTFLPIWKSESRRPGQISRIW